MQNNKKVLPGLPMKTFKTGRKVTDWKQIEIGSEFKLDEKTVVVMSNVQEEKVSKTGKKRVQRYLDIRFEDYKDIIKVNSDSFKAATFRKRLEKASVNKMTARKKAKKVKIQPKQGKEKYSSIPAVYDAGGVRDGLGGMLPTYMAAALENIYSGDNKEISKAIRQYAKAYHPDANGGDNREGTKKTWNILTGAAEHARQLNAEKKAEEETAKPKKRGRKPGSKNSTTKKTPAKKTTAKKTVTKKANKQD